MLFRLKRRLYLAMKKMVNNHPTLKRLNHFRRSVRGASVRGAVSEHGLDTAQKAVAALEAQGLEPVLTFGTLLGAVREHNLIDWDNDIDLGIIVDANDTAVWDRVKEALESAGFPIARQYQLFGRITEQAYESDGFSFDMWGLCRMEGTDALRAYYHCQVDDADYQSPDDRSVKYIDMPVFTARRMEDVSGYSLPVPGNAEEMLACVYGPNWATPDPTFVSGTGWILMDGVVERRTVFRDVR